LVNCLGKSVTILAFFQTKCPLLLESWLKKLPHKFHYWRKKNYLNHFLSKDVIIFKFNFMSLKNYELENMQ
jgi:hypothetical protein